MAKDIEIGTIYRSGIKQTQYRRLNLVVFITGGLKIKTI